MLSFTGKGIKFPAVSPEGQEIRVCPTPEELLVPLCPSAGKATRLLVSAGQKVARYAPLSRGETLSVYAPLSGTVTGFVRQKMAGELQTFVRLLPDVAQPDEAVYASIERPDWKGLLSRAQAASIIELFSGLSLFSRLERLPEHRCFAICTVDDGPDSISSTIVLDRFFREIVSAADWLSAATGIGYCFAIGNPYLKARLKSRYPDVDIRSAGRRYPVRWFLQKAFDSDVLLLDAISLLQLFRAIAHGRPAISSFVSVSNGGYPAVWEVPVGTPVGTLFASPPSREERLVSGGGLRGRVCTPEAPVTWTTTAVSLLPEMTVQPTDCIGCGLCCKVCPAGVYPLYVWEEAVQQSPRAFDYGVESCIGCGACTYVCPARLPLAQVVQRTKVMLREEKRNV